MAATVTIDSDMTFVTGDRKEVHGSIQLGTYATNGIAVAASDFGLAVLQDLTVNCATLSFEFDKANSKVKAYLASVESAEIDISAYVARYTAIGR